MPLPIIQHYFNDCDILINKWMDPATNRSLLSSDPFLSNSPVLSGSPYYDAMPEPFLGDPDNNLAVIVETAAMNNRQKKMGYNGAKELMHSLGIEEMEPTEKELEIWQNS